MMQQTLCHINKNILLLILSWILCACDSNLGASTNSENNLPLCGTTEYPPSTLVPAPVLESTQVWSFYSAPLLHPMKVSVATYDPSQLASGLIFNTPYTLSNAVTYGQTGALIMNNAGDPVWFRPLNSPNLMNTDFKVQQLYGSPVLTFWQGTISTSPAYTNLPGGSPEPGGCFYILNQNYHVLKTVAAFYGFVPNLHEFIITPNNTALFLASKTVALNLTPYGGPESGAVYDFSIQEVDLATNKLVYFWDALGHIPLHNSHMPAFSAIQSNNIWDAFHLNSLALVRNSSNTILISGRNTWTIYLLDKLSGNFKWQLAGDGSGDFKIAESSASFSWQHDVRLLQNNTLSLFDDNCCSNIGPVPPGTPPSHGLILNLDFQNMLANFESSYYHNPNLSSSSQGSFQWLANGNKFIGWGSNGYYSEFAEAGNTQYSTGQSLLYTAQMPGSNMSYRSYRMAWVGMPDYPPSIAVQTGTQQNTVYASWNGSTETSAWQVLVGLNISNLKLVATVARQGFETAIPVAAGSGMYYQTRALNAEGKVIGTSAIVQAE